MSDPLSRIESQLRIGALKGGIGARRIALLEAIADTGSISAAARTIGMSYKGAWDAVEAMNNLADVLLVKRVTGGTHGGGSRLTERGQRLVRTYRAAEEEQTRFLERLNRRLRHVRDDIDLMGRFEMMTSARNQLFGHVQSIHCGAVNTQVTVALRGGDTLTAVITRASAENLGLEPGSGVTALIKASWLIVAAGDVAQARLSARNSLAGRVEALTMDDVSSEIVLRLPGGSTLAAVITRESAERLNLGIGDTASALFKASSVILAATDPDTGA